MHERGVSYVRIAKALKVNEITVARYCKNGIQEDQCKPKKPTKINRSTDVMEVVEFHCKCCNGGMVRFQRFYNWALQLTADCDSCGQTFDRSAFSTTPTVRTNKAVVGHRVGAMLTESQRVKIADNELEYARKKQAP